jgi:hypothetical protein
MLATTLKHGSVGSVTPLHPNKVEVAVIVVDVCVTVADVVVAVVVVIVAEVDDLVVELVGSTSNHATTPSGGIPTDANAPPSSRV